MNLLWTQLQHELSTFEKQFMDGTLSGQELLNDLDNMFGMEVARRMVSTLFLQKQKHGSAKEKN